jgi:hypothetical protein
MEQTGIFRLVNRYWNGATATGDALPGQSVAGYTGQPPQYAGQLGIFAYISFADAQKKSDPTVTASLQGGRYQYVQFAADSTNYAQGQVLFWKDETNYIVTNNPGANVFGVAGICIAPVTQGNYWLMQTDGVAQVLFHTGTGVVAGQTVVAAVNNPADAISILDNTAIVAGTAGAALKLWLGTAKAAPTASTISTVYLKGITQVQ